MYVCAPTQPSRRKYGEPDARAPGIIFRIKDIACRKARYSRQMGRRRRTTWKRAKQGERTEETLQKKKNKRRRWQQQRMVRRGRGGSDDDGIRRNEFITL